MSRKKRTEQTLEVLLRHGRITEAMGHAVYGRYHVGGAIYRLRHGDRHLLPKGMEIVSYERFDVSGERFVEWRLEPVRYPSSLKTDVFTSGLLMAAA